MDNRINFNDAALRKAASEAAPRLLNLTQNLDQISEDIKRLEAWLSEHGLCIEVSIEVDGRRWVSEGGSESANEKNHLRWQKHDGRWRLVYCSRYTCHYMSEPPVYETRPLIETPAEVRIKVRKHLPSFLQKVAALLPHEKTEALELDDSEIPF